MKAVILAGGLGTRLSEETHSRPKPMVEIGGMPILWHIMNIFDNGDDACPFNYPHWDFMMRHAETLSKNPRMGMVYRNIEKMDEAKKSAAKASATKFLEALK